MNVEEQILDWLKQHDAWQARAAAKMVTRYGSIVLAYAEHTGGHIAVKDMYRVLSDACFTIAEQDERPSRD